MTDRPPSPPRRPRRRVDLFVRTIALGVLLSMGRPADAAAPAPSPVGADALQRPAPPRGEPAAAKRNPNPEGRRPKGDGRWWLGTAGVALALAACGWVSIAARRFGPKPGSGPSSAIRVVGRTSLSPKHSVYLLDVGGRVLIVGTGAQGPPSLLGELNDADEFARPGPAAPPVPAATSRAAVASRFDRRIGDES